MYLNVIINQNEVMNELLLKKIKTVILQFQTNGIENLGISDELGPCEVWKKVLCR